MSERVTNEKLDELITLSDGPKVLHWGDINAALRELRELRMSEWISVKDRLPKPHRSKRKPCPAVVVWYKNGAISNNLISLSTSNVEYLRKHPEMFTHWMQVPDPPKEAA